MDVEELILQIENLKKKEKEVDEEIGCLRKEGYKEEELAMHIEKLHEYNEIKDAAQLILGKLAAMEGITTREIHEKYGLDPDD